MILLRTVGGAEHAASRGKLSKYCEEFGLREKAAIEVRKLRQQLTNEILLNIPNLDLIIDPEYVLYLFSVYISEFEYHSL